jgi:hypothetical protein
VSNDNYTNILMFEIKGVGNDHWWKGWGENKCFGGVAIHGLTIPAADDEWDDR